MRDCYLTAPPSSSWFHASYSSCSVLNVLMNDVKMMLKISVQLENGYKMEVWPSACAPSLPPSFSLSPSLPLQLPNSPHVPNYVLKHAGELQCALSHGQHLSGARAPRFKRNLFFVHVECISPVLLSPSGLTLISLSSPSSLFSSHSHFIHLIPPVTLISILSHSHLTVRSILSHLCLAHSPLSLSHLTLISSHLSFYLIPMSLLSPSSLTHILLYPTPVLLTSHFLSLSLFFPGHLILVSLSFQSSLSLTALSSHSFLTCISLSLHSHIHTVSLWSHAHLHFISL